MDEVTKLYENAGIKSKAECTSKVCIVTNPHKDWCNKCESLKYEYPIFTAEKQLEMIKWLAYKMHITIGKGLPWGQYDDVWWTVTSKKGYAGTNAHKLEEALANFVNCLWQDLTEEDKQQIKEILE